jgi:ParB-like chromosome segregation protein Spo0J
MTMALTNETLLSTSSLLTVAYLPVMSLKPYANNARTHSKRQIRQIATSIETFGFTNPILIDDRHTIVAGHGRVEAAKLLRLDQVPTVQLAGLSEHQIRAYILADNRLAEQAGWDESILAIELQHLLSIDCGDFSGCPWAPEGRG